MFGAVYGDIIGSYYEVHATKQMDFPLFVPQSTFTDDTVMTAAVCETLLAGRRRRVAFWSAGTVHGNTLAATGSITPATLPPALGRCSGLGRRSRN